MKQYVIDELRPSDHEKVKAYMDDHFDRARIEGIYWIPLGEKQLAGVQMNHMSCQPFYFAVELEPHRLACELLVRTQKRIRCDCIQYATETQRNWLIELMDAILEKLEIVS